MGSNPIPSATTKPREFDKSLSVGESGECMLWAWLYMQYGDRLKHVSEYHEPTRYGKYRDEQNLRMPDFRIDGERLHFVETKMKIGWHGRLNLDGNQVRDYLRVAKKHDADFTLYFIHTAEGKMYRFTEEDIKNYTRREIDRKNNDFFLYEKEDIEVVFNKMPKALFNTDRLYVK